MKEHTFFFTLVWNETRNERNIDFPVGKFKENAVVVVVVNTWGL